MRVIFTLLAASVCLGGCQTVDAANCRGYGYTPGTDAFADCMRQQDTFRRQALLSTGTALMIASQPPPQPVVIAPSNTTCTRFGNTVNCRSY